LIKQIRKKTLIFCLLSREWLIQPGVRLPQQLGETVGTSKKKSCRGIPAKNVSEKQQNKKEPSSPARRPCPPESSIWNSVTYSSKSKTNWKSSMQAWKGKYCDQFSALPLSKYLMLILFAFSKLYLWKSRSHLCSLNLLKFTGFRGDWGKFDWSCQQGCKYSLGG
jgi:hypothetical protein